MIKSVNSDNFILTYISDGLAYPVFLNKEQKEMFKFAIMTISGVDVIKVGEKPIGKVTTLDDIWVTWDILRRKNNGIKIN